MLSQDFAWSSYGSSQGVGYTLESAFPARNNEHVGTECGMGAGAFVPGRLSCDD